MTKTTIEQALGKTQGLWVVELHESELGYSDQSWSEFYPTYEKAHKRYTEVNAENPTGPAPDYYIIASKPRKLTST